MGLFVLRDVLVRKENEGSVGGHAFRETEHKGLGLDVEVSEHCVGAPASQELDLVGVDIGTE